MKGQAETTWNIPRRQSGISGRIVAGGDIGFRNHDHFSFRCWSQLTRHHSPETSNINTHRGAHGFPVNTKKNMDVFCYHQVTRLPFNHVRSRDYSSVLGLSFGQNIEWIWTLKFVISQHDQETHNCHTLQLKLQKECAIEWYWYMTHSENHCTECDIGWCPLMSLDENNCTKCEKVLYNDRLAAADFICHDAGNNRKCEWKSAPDERREYKSFKCHVYKLWIMYMLYTLHDCFAI